MMIYTTISIDGDTLQAMKRRMAQMVLEAKAAVSAYEDAVIMHWKQTVSSQIGQCPFSHRPVECVLTDAEGTRVIQAQRIFVSEQEPHLEFRERTKSGKWGKTDFSHKLPCKLQNCTQG